MLISVLDDSEADVVGTATTEDVSDVTVELDTDDVLMDNVEVFPDAGEDPETGSAVVLYALVVLMPVVRDPELVADAEALSDAEIVADLEAFCPLDPDPD